MHALIRLHFILLQLTHLTASMRFEGPLNVDLNEITTTLVPYPRLHFLQSSVAPLYLQPDVAAMSVSRQIDGMFQGAFSRGQQLTRGNPRSASHLACGLLLRGDVVMSDVTRNVQRLKGELHMTRWNPDGTCYMCACVCVCMFVCAGLGCHTLPTPARCCVRTRVQASRLAFALHVH